MHLISHLDTERSMNVHAPNTPTPVLFDITFYTVREEEKGVKMALQTLSIDIRVNTIGDSGCKTLVDGFRNAQRVGTTYTTNIVRRCIWA
jgi:hypothetical protein